MGGCQSGERSDIRWGSEWYCSLLAHRSLFGGEVLVELSRTCVGVISARNGLPGRSGLCSSVVIIAVCSMDAG